ncbi:MAG: hypothetical protein AB7S26_10420 [Sandaracinaceae bacterium]
MVKRVIPTLVVVLFGALCLACGGDDSSSQRTTPEWQARERLPIVSLHWWGNPVERFCEETTDCERGEQCQQVRLSSCRNGCPRGEDARVCVPHDWNGDMALTYETPTPDTTPTPPEQ